MSQRAIQSSAGRPQQTAPGSTGLQWSTSDSGLSPPMGEAEKLPESLLTDVDLLTASGAIKPRPFHARVARPPCFRQPFAHPCDSSFLPNRLESRGWRSPTSWHQPSYVALRSPIATHASSLNRQQSAKKSRSGITFEAIFFRGLFDYGRHTKTRGASTQRLRSRTTRGSRVLQ